MSNNVIFEQMWYKNFKLLDADYSNGRNKSVPGHTEKSWKDKHCFYLWIFVQEDVAHLLSAAWGRELEDS